MLFFAAADAFQDFFNDAIDDIPEEHAHGTSHTPSSKASAEPEGVEFVHDDSNKSQDGKADFEGGIQVADWQNSLENPAAQEDLSTIVFEDCVKLFSLVFHIIRKSPLLAMISKRSFESSMFGMIPFR
jgi:hypothetical protein